MNKKQRAAARRNKKESAQRERQERAEREELLVQQERRAEIERKVKLARERLAQKEREELLAQIKIYFAEKDRQERLAQKENQGWSQTSSNGVNVSSEENSTTDLVKIDSASFEENSNEVIIELVPQEPRMGTVPKDTGRFLNPLLFPDNNDVVYDENIR